MSPVIWTVLLMAPLVGLWLYGTRTGLTWRAVGESVEHALALGIIRPRLGITHPLPRLRGRVGWGRGVSSVGG